MTQKTYMIHVAETRDKLNAVGPGFCMMKWRNESLYLHMGDNHSCYHPRPRHIDLKEIENDVSALHNTAWKKQQRKEMLEGGKPEECYYCWNIENLKGEHYSDRMFHSASSWVDIDKDIDLIKAQPWDANYNPQFLELSFSNNCNFACGYCCPQSSTLWMKEIQEHGNYDISYNQYGIEFLSNGTYQPDEENNPYIDAFWKWWPSLSKDLRIFRLTGGEALMHPSTFKLLEMIDKNPAPELELNINSNMGVANSRVTRALDLIKKLLAEGKIKKFKFYTSIDSYGEQAEYMRRGLDVKLWEQNIDSYLTTIPGSEISFMVTYNVLSVAYFRPLLEKILDMRAKYNVGATSQRINFDTPYLKEPPHWTMNILPKDKFGHYLDDDLQFIKDNLGVNHDLNKFGEHEYEKFKRVRDYFYEGGDRINDESTVRGRKDFYKFFIEYDRRSNSSLLNTFPIYTEFFNLCKGLVESC